MNHARLAIAAARQWIGTPYHHRAMVRGEGCDCLALVLVAYQAAGIVPPDFAVPDYPVDIMFHSDDCGYLDGVLTFCDEVTDPAPGDIALFKYGKTFSHSALIVAWPTVIHAYAPFQQVIEMSTLEDSRLLQRPVRFFRPKVSA